MCREQQVFFGAVYQHLLVAFRGATFSGGNEPRTNVGEVRAQHFHSANGAAIGNTATHHQRPVEELAYSGHEREWR